MTNTATGKSGFQYRLSHMVHTQNTKDYTLLLIYADKGESLLIKNYGVIDRPGSGSFLYGERSHLEKEFSKLERTKRGRDYKVVRDTIAGFHLKASSFNDHQELLITNKHSLDAVPIKFHESQFETMMQFMNSSVGNESTSLHSVSEETENDSEWGSWG